MVDETLTRFGVRCEGFRYHQGKVYVIDVSQSVEHDHPHALEFLRKDCTNITDFFKKHGVCTLTVKELFDFVVDPTITADNLDDYLDTMSARASERVDATAQDLVNEEVFKKTYIPQRLDEVTSLVLVCTIGHKE